MCECFGLGTQRRLHLLKSDSAPDGPVDVAAAVREFLADPHRSSLELPYLSIGQRHDAKMLAEQHLDLKCETFGLGKDQRLHLFKLGFCRVGGCCQEDESWCTAFLLQQPHQAAATRLRPLSSRIPRRASYLSSSCLVFRKARRFPAPCFAGGRRISFWTGRLCSQRQTGCLARSYLRNSAAAWRGSRPWACP